MADSCCCSAPLPLPKTRLRVRPPIRFGPGRLLRSETVAATLENVPERTCQIMLGPLLPSSLDLEKSRKILEERDGTLYVHCPLNVNLARGYNVGSVRDILGVLRDLPAAAVVHIGRNGALQGVADALDGLREDGCLSPGSGRTPRKLLLEVAAGQKGELGRNEEEIRSLLERVDKSQFGLCLDTQHAFAAGVSDFANHESVVKLFDSLESLLPISLLHLNDSCGPLGCLVDRHQILGRGHIWYREREGLSSLLALAAEKQIDLVSETPNYREDCALVERL